MNDTIKLIDFRLGDILRERNLTQRKAAELTGLSENAISKLAGVGLRQIRIDTITALCNGLSLTPADLFKEIDGIKRG